MERYRTVTRKIGEHDKPDPEKLAAANRSPGGTNKKKCDG